MANLIVKASEFAPSSQMIYGKPSVNKKGGKSINILNSTTKKWLTLHTPMMLTYGVMQRVNDDGSTTYYMSLQFPRDEFTNKDCQDLKQVMSEMEEKIIQDAFTNSRDWFGKKYNSIDVLRELWTPMLKYPKNKEDGSLDTTRAPTIKVKLPIYKNKDGTDDAKFDLFDMNSRSIYPNDSCDTPDVLVQKGSNVCCVVTCGGIWFASGKFGVTWKLNQAVVKPPDTFEKGKCYIPMSTTPTNDKPVAYDSDGESDPVKDQLPKEEVQVETPKEEPVETPNEEPTETVKEEPVAPKKKTTKKATA